MANNDWDLDDLLDFRFDREIPEVKKDDFSTLDELDRISGPRKPEVRKGLGDTFDRYNEIRHSETPRRPENGAGVYGLDVPEPLSSHRPPEFEDMSFFEKYDRGGPSDSPQAHGIEEEPEKKPVFSGSKEIDAIRKASQDAYDRYRSNYTKKKKSREKRSGKGRVSGFDKFLSIVYVAAFVLFILAMTVMNVLPLGIAAALYGILILISLVILVQTRKRNIRNWVKWLARFTAVLLIAFYGMGTVYALGTMSFLSGTSVDNEKAVADITRQPFNFVITGIDVDGKISEEGRSDVNMVVTVNPSTHQMLLTSIPRDYQIYMPDHDNAMDKLTHTGFYGVPTTTGAEEQLLDTTINYYVKVNFTTVERFIDAVGGVDVESEYEFTPVKLKDWTVQEGMNHMNGKQALAFARERKAFPDGDRQRIKNQQAVFEALIRKATSSRTMIMDYNNVLSSLQDYVEMSFSSREVRRLVKFQLAKDPDWQIYKNTITGGDGTGNTYSAGYAYVMTQDDESIGNAKTLINAVLNGQMLQKDDEGKVTVVPEEGE